jgi:MFS family permease
MAGTGRTEPDLLLSQRRHLCFAGCGAVQDLHWSQTAAGVSFSLLGIACGVASPLPALLMKHIGGRRVVVLGGACLACGFWLAFAAAGLPLFYVAMIFLGLGYALAGNIPGVYLLASWFPQTSSRVIGLYFMIGAAGNVVGPPLVAAVVAASHSWRFNWLLMAILAVLITLLCLLCIRDAPAPGAAAEHGTPAAAVLAWRDRDAMLTRQFMLVAASMTLTVAGITTTSSVAVTHLVHLGTTPAFAAFILSLVALVATLAKGAAGRLSENVRPSRVLAAGLLLQSIGDVAISTGDSRAGDYLFACAFGVGWGFSYVAANLVLLEYFGREVGARILSAVWMISTLAAAGPAAAGMIADHFGTFSPIFVVYAVLLSALGLPIFFMRCPVRAASMWGSLGGN